MEIKIIFFFIVFSLSDCIYIKNHELGKIKYPETAYFSGFAAGRSEVNINYSEIWCRKYCEEIKLISNNLSEEYYIEIIAKVDGTETLDNRQKLSFGRSNAIKQLLLNYGISQTKLKAITDPEPNVFLGKDLFDPENRFVLFRIQKK